MGHYNFIRELGRAGVTSSLRMAHYALEKATPKVAYTITIEGDKRVRMMRSNAAKTGIVATFRRDSNPDWLANEIREAADLLGARS